MKVLFVTPLYEPALVYGGIVRASVDWARALSAAGVAVSVFTTAANGERDLDLPLGVPLDRDGIQVTYFPRWRRSGRGFVSPSLLRACVRATSKFDILHSIGLWAFPSLVSTWVAQWSGIPYVVSLHGMLMPWPRQHHGRRKNIFMTLLERPRLIGASRLICCSEIEQQCLKKTAFSNRSCVIPNVVNGPGAVRTPERFRARYGLQNAFIILFAGRLVENKGLHLTLAAFAKSAALFPDIHLVVVGPVEDASSGNIRRQVREMGLEHRVQFTGLLQGMEYWEAIAGADMFILNSYSENFGLAAAEALVSGVPVLLSDQVGIADLVTQYGAGVITPLKVDAIAEAIMQMRSQRQGLYEMGQNGIRLVRDHFSSSVVGPRFARLLEQVLEEHGRLSSVVDK